MKKVNFNNSIIKEKVQQWHKMKNECLNMIENRIEDVAEVLEFKDLYESMNNIINLIVRDTEQDIKNVIKKVDWSGDWPLLTLVYEACKSPDRIDPVDRLEYLQDYIHVCDKEERLSVMYEIQQLEREISGVGNVQVIGSEDDPLAIINKMFTECESCNDFRNSYRVVFEINQFGNGKFFFYATAYYLSKGRKEEELFHRNSLHIKGTFETIEEIRQEIDSFKSYNEFKKVYGK